MSRDVHITVVQPPAVGPMVSHQDMRQRALDLLNSAGAAGAAFDDAAAGVGCSCTRGMRACTGRRTGERGWGRMH